MGSLSCCDFDDCLKALADDTRQDILSLLQKQEMCVGELGEHFAITQPTLSHHLAVLRETNLVVSHRSGRQIRYRANPTCIVQCAFEILACIRKGTS
jgi:ArsR family transcriptional regulator